MINRKCLNEVIKNQETILNAIKSLENNVKDLKTGQIRLEMVVFEKKDEIDFLMKMKSKEEISKKIDVIDRNIDLLSKMIENCTTKGREASEKRTEKPFKVGPTCHVDENVNPSCNEVCMKTSTPKPKKRKILQCLGNCSIKSQCANCIVKDMLKSGEISLEGSFVY